ncbi:MAG: multidrug ABC transporter ATP-binding protein [Firmicutes bacterium HGW-Firmicutes-7]|nr:MAG: multidrug ABC transporter ATP-binding protein [Firmicutes bacterium HGW-Firmicutes-7]
MLKLFKYLKPFRFPIIIVLILTFIKTLSDLYLPNLMADIVDIGIVKGDHQYIFQIGEWMLLIAAIGTGAVIMSSYLSAKIAAAFSRDLRSAIFTRVESFSLHEFDKFGTSTLITRTTNDINQVQQVLIMILRMMISAPIMCVGGIIMAATKDIKLSLVLILVIPVLSIFMLLVAKKAMPLFKSIQVKLDGVNLVLREGLIGIRVIRAFNRVDFENKRFNTASRNLVDTTIKVNKIMAILMPMMILVINLTTLAIIWFGSMRIDTGNMEIGDMLAFTQYLMQIMFSIMIFAMMFIMIPRASASAIRINEVLDTVPEITDTKTPNSKEGEKGTIEFKNVTFSYHGAEQPAIRNISFKACPSEVTAIIGGTGSGKSTLINMIPRFYDVDSGQILVNEVDIRDMSQEALRSKIGFVPQKTILFNGTIADNIRFGKETATIEEVIKAANCAQATEFINDMPEGFDRLISQGGTNISGGQKQRLSIARALVKEAKIYVFDDSFSALDFKTDAKLRAALKQKKVHATVLIVAQRVSTIMDADQIIVLNDGGIVGIGKHKELLKTCEVYREIVASQLSEEELA